MQPSNEIWKPVLNYEGVYEISSSGRLKRIRSARGGIVGKIIKPQLPSEHHSYAYYVLYHNNTIANRKIAVLVCEAFHGKPQKNQVVGFNDGDKNNWSSDNVRWVKRSTISPNTYKTHCIRNHEYTPENTVRSKNGSRHCRTCDKLFKRQRRSHGQITTSSVGISPRIWHG